MGAAPQDQTHRNQHSPDRQQQNRSQQDGETRRKAWRERKRRRRQFLTTARRNGRIPDGPGPEHTVRVYPEPVPVKRAELAGKHTRTALKTAFRTLTKGVVVSRTEEEGCPDEFRIPAQDCGGFLVDIITRARAHWLLNTLTVIGYWGAAAYHGLPYWCDGAPVVLLHPTRASGNARSTVAARTPWTPVFRQRTAGLTTVCPDPRFPTLRVVTVDTAAAQCLHSLLSGTHGWKVPVVPGLTVREVRAVQFLDAMFQCSRLTCDDVRRGCRNLVDADLVDRLLTLADPGAQSPRETLLRLYARNLLPAGCSWTSQVTVLLDPENRPWKHLVADLACEELKIALFYDGSYHRAEERRSLDFHQVQRLRALGWEAVRVDAALMAEVATMTADMQDAVDRAATAAAPGTRG